MNTTRLTDTGGYVNYNDNLDADQQITMEEDIAHSLFQSRTEPEADLYSEEYCAEMGRRILALVLSEFRPDLIDKEGERQTD